MNPAFAVILGQLAEISGESLIWLVVWLCIAGMIFWVIQWGISQFKIPEPFATVIKFIMILGIVIILINALLGVVGKPFIRW